MSESDKDSANPKNDNTGNEASDADLDWAAALSEQAAAEGKGSPKPEEDDWAAALSEQAAADARRSGSQAEGLGGDDDWAAALAEQTAATSSRKEPDAPAADSVGSRNAAPAATRQAAPAAPARNTIDERTSKASPASHVFQPLVNDAMEGASDIDLIMDIPVQLSVELGRTRLTIKNILQLGQGSVVELDGLAGEPMDIYVNGYLIAQGEVVVVEEKYGIRVTDIITPADRIHRLNGRR